MEGRYNLRSPAVKRLMREAQELSEATEQYFAQPLDDNLFEWHFTIRGPGDSDFAGGIYHGRIILPPDYPMKPPSIIFLTANGRFDCFTKICLSISRHHPESWQPSWSIRTALLAIIGFMPSPGHGAIGSLDYTPTERQQLAKKSVAYECETCGKINDKVLPLTSTSDESKEEMRNLAAQLSMVGEGQKKTPIQEHVGEVGDTGAAAPAVTEEITTTPTRPILRQRIPHPSTNGPITEHHAASYSATQANSQANSADTGSAPSNASPAAQTTQSSRRSNSCGNRLTYWALVIVGALLGLLLLRRFILNFSHHFVVDEDL